MLQVRWGGRNQEGAGNTVGEEIECYCCHYCHCVEKGLVGTQARLHI